VQQLGTADVEDAYQARRAHAQRDASHTHHLRTYARTSRRTKRCCSMQEM
jgi:C4-dicarboxylate-specific signal transduction histidine kinase